MRHVLTLVVLVLLVQIALQSGLASLDASLDTLTILTAGFILVGSYALGELFRTVRLPALLGYLCAGILFGPKLAELLALRAGLSFDAPLRTTVLSDLSLVNILAIGVIGTMGGGEIKLSELRRNAGQIAAICGCVFLSVLPIVFGVVLGLTFVAPQFVPFLAELPLPGRIAGALLFAALAVGMSPSATLALLQEVRAHGRFTSLVLGVVVLGDLVLVATFLFVLAFARLVVSPEGFSQEALIHELPHIALEFGWAIAIGIAVGILYIVYLRFVRREILLFSLAVVFATSFVAARLHAETLLAFLVAGFIVQNFSRHGHALIEAFEQIALPVFVIYFTTQAAGLNLVAATAYLPLTLILVFTRSTLFVGAVGLGARIARVDATTRGQLLFSFISQGGVDLVLAAMIANAIPGWGVEIQTVTVGTILFYIVAGPPLLARALDRMGESAAARERGELQLEEGNLQRLAVPAARDTDAELDTPKIDDHKLALRLGQLRRTVGDLVGPGLVDGVQSKARARRHEMFRAADRVRVALESYAEGDAGSARKAADALDRDLLAQASTWANLALEPLDRDQLEHLFHTLADAVPFSEVHRVIREERFFSGRGAIRSIRRARRGIAGPGVRVVPLGRAWRYHVSLSVPLTLWNGVKPDEARPWHLLVEHYERTHAVLTALADDTWRELARKSTASASSSGHGHVDPSGDDSAAPAPADEPDLHEWFAGELAAGQAREAQLRNHLDGLDDRLARNVRNTLADAWASFVRAAELGGTLELPVWRDRPSSRHDAAQAAEAQLYERSDRDRDEAEGMRDTLHAYVASRTLADRARGHVAGVAATAREILLRLGSEIDAIASDARGLDALFDAPDGKTLVDAAASIGRRLETLAAGIDEAQERLHEESLDDRDPQRLLWDVPERVSPTRAGSFTSGRARIEIPLRTWLGQTVVREVAVSRTNCDDELSKSLATIHVDLHHAREVLEYHVNQAAETESDLGDRVATVLERTRNDVTEHSETIPTQAAKRVAGSAAEALDLVTFGRWEEIRRRARRLRRGGTRTPVVERVFLRARAAVRFGSRVAARASDELVALLTDRPTVRAARAYRALLFGARSDMPDPYQRLFTSVPAESIGLIVERPELTPLREAVDEWARGHGGAILLYGDRGAGKRTIVRHVLGELDEAIEVEWVRLGPTLERESAVVRELSRCLRCEAQGSYADLAAMLETRASIDGSGPPILVVVENADRLFRRNAGDVETFRRFLDLVTGTPPNVQWIALFAESAVAILDPVVELRARFRTTIHVPPVDAPLLDRAIEVRHRLSAYPLRREPGAPAPNEWLRSPISALRWYLEPAPATTERLVQLSGGNIRQGLRLWLASARLDDRDPQGVVVGPLPSEPCNLLAELPLTGRLVLVALIVHGPLWRSDLELAAFAGRGGAGTRDHVDLDAELVRLTRLGLVVIERPGRGKDSLISIETRLVHPITAELRSANLI